MGSRFADSLAVVKRAKKAGWQTERANDGRYYVWDATGRKHVVHMTYSDGLWSLKNLVQDLERGGLTQAEEKMANVRLTETRTRASQAKAAADARAKELAAQAAIAKAAGPYLIEAEACDPGWLFAEHPQPWMRWMKITPEAAQEALDEHNNDNRPRSDRQTDHYRNIILSGQWHLTHQGVAFDSRGILQDGQHRLQAVVDAGESIEDLQVPFAVFVGMPPENFKAIDEGLLRKAAQLYAKGGEKNATTLAQAVRLVYAYADQTPRRVMRMRVTNEIMVDTFEASPDEFRNSAAFAQSNARKLSTSPGSVAAAHYLIRRANGVDNTFVEAFFAGLTTGLKAGTRMVLDDDDPRAVFRETMQASKMKRRKVSGIDQMAMVILSWNNCVTGYRPRLMRFAEDSPIPRVTICMDTGERASAIPAVFAGEIDTHEDDE